MQYYNITLAIHCQYNFKVNFARRLVFVRSDLLAMPDAAHGLMALETYAERLVVNGRPVREAIGMPIDNE